MLGVVLCVVLGAILLVVLEFPPLINMTDTINRACQTTIARRVRNLAPTFAHAEQGPSWTKRISDCLDVLLGDDLYNELATWKSIAESRQAAVQKLKAERLSDESDLEVTVQKLLLNSKAKLGPRRSDLPDVFEKMGIDRDCHKRSEEFIELATSVPLDDGVVERATQEWVDLRGRLGRSFLGWYLSYASDPLFLKSKCLVKVGSLPYMSVWCAHAYRMLQYRERESSEHCVLAYFSRSNKELPRDPGRHLLRTLLALLVPTLGPVDRSGRGWRTPSGEDDAESLRDLLLEYLRFSTKTGFYCIVDLTGIEKRCEDLEEAIELLQAIRVKQMSCKRVTFQKHFKLLLVDRFGDRRRPDQPVFP